MPTFFIAFWLSPAKGSVEGGRTGAALGGDRHQRLLEELKRLASRITEQSGLELVDLTMKGSGNRRRLRVDIDRSGAAGVTLEDCQEVSRKLGEAIEAEEIIQDSYLLEVSSPGADRPIKTADDIRRNTGRMIVVSTDEPVDGRRSFKGLLLGGENSCIRLAEEGDGEVIIPLGKVQIARQDIGI